MTFDPFGDFETRGYLRNVASERDITIVKRLEHAAFLTGIDGAFASLAKRKEVSYEDILATHKTLFASVYPWAGQDRMQTAPLLTIKKGNMIFANPPDIRRAVEYGLQLGQNRDFMIERPGEVMGYLAFGHPFLDGNGRTIMTVHAIMAQRAGFSINWSSTDKFAYLDALTREIERPGKGHLDSYLRRFAGEPVPYNQLTAHVAAVPGLDGSEEAQADEVLGESTSSGVREQYEGMLQKRQE